MIEILNNGLKVLKGSDGIYSLLFNSKKAKLSIEYVKEHRIKRIMVNPYHGYTSTGLKPLLPLSDWIEELIVGSDNISYDGLGEFSHLKTLGVLDNGKDIVDLISFPNLNTLNCSFSKRLLGLENCGYLKELTVSNYNSVNNNLCALPPLPQLEYLSLIKANITELNGIERFDKLEVLEIFMVSRLESIESLKHFSNRNLKKIQFDKCKKIEAYDILGEVNSLQKIIMSESGKMSSLSFIEKLSNLKFLSFWGTNVLDGDLSYCKNLEYVGFDDKRHYSHKMKEFLKS